MEQLGLKKSLQPAAQEGAGEASGSATPAPAEEQEKHRKRPAELEAPEEPRAAKKMIRRLVTKDEIDRMRAFAGKKELVMITSGAYKMGSRMVGDGAQHKQVEEVFVRTVKYVQQAVAKIVEYDAKGFVEVPAYRELPLFVDPFAKQERSDEDRPNLS